MKAIYFDGDNGLIVRKEEIPENLMKTVRERKLELVAALADVEPKFEDYFMEENINIPAKELNPASKIYFFDGLSKRSHKNEN